MLTSNIKTAPRPIEAVPLTHERFAPFGEVVAHAGDSARRYLQVPAERAHDAGRLMVWVTQVVVPGTLPLRVVKLERHRFSAQTFIPLRVQRYLVVVGPNGSDGLPDLSRLEAFIANPDQGVAYRQGTWHHGLTALDGTAEFAVMMSIRGNGDDEFWDVPEPIDIVPGAA